MSDQPVSGSTEVATPPSPPPVKPTAAPATTDPALVELLRQLQGLRAEVTALRERGSKPAPALPTGAIPRWGHIIDTVPASAIADVVAACEAGLAVPANGGGGEDVGKMLAPLAALAPAVADAAAQNSIARRKPVAHSLRVIVERLAARGRA